MVPPSGQGPNDRPDALDLVALTAWLQEHVDGFAGPVAATKFAGGQSNPTYRLRTSQSDYVLRRKPFGPILPSAHAVDREYWIMAALHPTGFPVPLPYALCEDPDIIGAPFFVMAMVEGRSFWDGTLPDLTPAGRTAIYDRLIGTLAQLHRIEPAAVGLADYGPPGNYFERQVRRWTKQYRAAQTEDLGDVEQLIDWLPRTLPAQDRVSIIHGDFRIDNLIYASQSPKVEAVLDWELSTLGDPLADFTYVAMNWATPVGDRGAGLAGVDFAATGIPSLEEATGLYCELTQRRSIPDLNWYFAYNLFRLVGIVQGIKKRSLVGNASNADAAQVAARVPRLAAQAWDFARRAGAA